MISTLYVSFTEVALAGIALLFVIIYFTRNKKDPRYPSGPKPIPLLGNVLQIGSDPLRTFQKWAEEYGPVYSIKFGTQDAVVINDPKLLKELFSDNNSTGRATNAVQQVFGNGYGIINAEDEKWAAQRRFSLRKLRDVGLLKSSIEGHLMEEANTLTRFFERKVGQPISGHRLFNGSVVNALWRIVSGESNDWDSPVQPEILKRAEDVISSINRTALSGLFFAPFLRYIAPGYFGWTDWVNAVDNFMKITNETVDKHYHSLDANNPRNFIDHYLIEMQETKDAASSFYKEAGEKNLKATVGDLFVAGSETSSMTLSWAWLYLSQNTDIQRKAQQELDLVVGASRRPSLSDKPLLPYIEAILSETLRLSSIASLGVPHRIKADMMFHGYFLPKDLTVISDMYTIHHSPKIWGKDFDMFRPDRFLNDDKTQVIRHEALIPFSIGKRQCLGENLARDTLFLFVAYILHKFNIDPDPECPVVDIKPIPGLMVVHKPFKFVMNLRKSDKSQNSD